MGGSKTGNTTSVVKYSRVHSPIHCKWKIESFSELLELETESYETGPFDAGDYKWRLVLYPTGHKQRRGEGYISLYVALDTESKKAMSPGWEIKVDLKLFVHDMNHGNYLVFQVMDVAINETTPEWGLAQLLCIQDFTDKSNGYLDGDCCTFGAEILVMHDSPQTETLSMIRNLNLGKEWCHPWKISNLKTSKKKCIVSAPFEVGGTKWKILFHPNGQGSVKGNWCSVFLGLHDVKTFPPNGKVFAEYKLRIRNQGLDQSQDKHVEITDKQWFSASKSSWGSKKFLPCGDLYDENKAFVLEDTLIIVAEFVLVSKIVRSPAA